MKFSDLPLMLIKTWQVKLLITQVLYYKLNIFTVSYPSCQTNIEIELRSSLSQGIRPNMNACPNIQTWVLLSPTLQSVAHETFLTGNMGMASQRTKMYQVTVI
jgi:hypothetical protein